MSDSEEPSQQPTPANTPKRPNQPERSDSEQSVDDAGYESRSRSQSRRRRRQNQRKRGQQQQQQQQTNQDGGGSGGAQAQSMTKIDEDQEAESQAQAQSSTSAMQPFERIGPDSTSMNGPVTHARAMRGEIPMRDGSGNQSLATAPEKSAESKGSSKGIMDEEGLKLRLELNLDIEIELKASIHGDLTLALLCGSMVVPSKMCLGSFFPIQGSDNDDRA